MLKVRFLDSEEIKEIDFQYISPHIVGLIGISEENKSGFYIYDSKGNMLGDYSKYTTIYRVRDNCIEFSDDGSVYVPPTKKVTVSVNWNDAGHEEERPSAVRVVIFKNSELLETRTFTSASWSHTYTGVPIDDEYSISVADITGYEKVIIGTSVFYTYPVEPEPSIEERLQAVEDLSLETFSTVESILTDIVPILFE